jgi:D-arabinose 1-dehydrogenase-like Zn-dependent alcohol dehydrogenase
MLPKTALASVLTEYGAPLQLQEVRVPTAEPGAVVVEVDVTSVCGSDVHLWRGAVASVLPFKPPLILGHEIVGKVVAIGPGADRDSLGQPLKLGDRVIWEHEACGACPMCTLERTPTLCPNRRVGMFSCVEVFPFSAGGFSQYSYVWPRAGRLRVPDGVSSKAAAAGSCALRTAVAAFEKLGPIDFMSRVTILGSGPLGLFATALASWHRPRHLVVVGAPNDRLQLARDWGATATVSIEDHPDPAKRAELIRDLTEGGPDVLLEMAGSQTAFAEGVDLAGRNARYVVVGSLGPAIQSIAPARIVGRGLRITGCLSGDIATYHRALEFLKLGQSDFNWEALFSDKVYDLAHATAALESLRKMTELKPVICPQLH